ncbi:hypothetical protein MKW92_023739 [Papaver armeniacum]|nr:hypothetical protein MKW92_023739 [Papaver armeniacum]
MECLNINIVEGGGLTKENNEEDSRVKSPPKVLLLLSCTFMSFGWIGGPLLTRLYFLHGGNGIWLSSWLQMAGFPILVIPLVILYFRRDRSQPNVDFFVCRKLLLYAALLGLFQGIASYMYSYGLSFLPVSTSSLLFTTQLISTSFVSYFWVKQKFTPYSINAIVVIMGCILLGIRGSVITHLVLRNLSIWGFFISIASASSVGFILVSTQVAYAKANQVMTYPIVLQFQFWFSFFATVSCTVGGLINKDFLFGSYSLSEEPGSYFVPPPLFAGVVGATILPFSQIAAVITFHESFTAEKGMALALTLWGFTSYFYGSYTNNTKARIMSIPP